MVSNKKGIKLHIWISSGEDIDDLCSFFLQKGTFNGTHDWCSSKMPNILVLGERTTYMCTDRN